MLFKFRFNGLHRLHRELLKIEGETDMVLLHAKMDKALLGYIDNKEITHIFNRSPKWYWLKET